MVELNSLYLQIPVQYEGEELHYYQKSVQTIIDDQDPHELHHLYEWLSRQFMTRCGISSFLEITKDAVMAILSEFEVLGIKPVDCYYDPNGDNEYDTNK